MSIPDEAVAIALMLCLIAASLRDMRNTTRQARNFARRHLNNEGEK